MKKLVLIVLYLITFEQLSAQTFDYKYDLGGQEGFVDVKKVNNNFIGVVSTGFKLDDWFAIYEDAKILKFNDSGVILDSLFIPNLIPYQISHWQGKLYLMGTTSKVNYTMNMRLRNLKFFSLDSNLNIFDSITYGDTNTMVFSPVEFMIDDTSGILIPVSQTNVLASDFHSSVLSFGQNLNLMAKRVYDTTRTINFPESIFLSHDSNSYIILHNGKYGDTTITSSKRGLSSLNKRTLQVDTSFLLSTGIQSPFLTNSDQMYQQVSGVQLPNKNILVKGVVPILDNHQQSLDELIPTMATIMFDTALNRINAQVFNAVDSADHPGGIHAISYNDDYVYIGGNKNWENTDVYQLQTSYFRLIKMDFSGNVIFEKFYTNGKHIHLNSVLATDDGGVLLAGSTYDTLNANQNGLDAYIMKVDSNGNVVTSLNEIKSDRISKLNYLIYPNPVADELNLQKVNQFIPYTFSIYDRRGRNVKEIEWLNDEKIISTESLSPGIYLYKIEDENGRTATGKLIKN